MSKKQRTLLESWGSANPSTSGTAYRSPAKQKPVLQNDVVDLVSDDEDEVLTRALELSLLDCVQQPTKQPNANGNARTKNWENGGSPLSTTALEDLPGFDYEAGKTWIYPCNYPVRSYQRTIVEKCLYNNTLVSLPTGLGKTFIAAVVMYNFFRWYPRSKIIFMAPTKPLVAQQVDACFSIMGIPQNTTSEMTGDMAPEVREKEWREKRLFFMTPQVMVNDLSRGLCPVQNVKCIVLDEAHKASGNYAYVQVIKEMNKLGTAFRVLALSATPGNDLQAIQQVISNLNISHLEMRNEDSLDIRPYSHQRLVDVVVVPLGTEVADIKDKYLHILGSYARRLMNMNLLFVRDIGSLTKFSLIKARDIFRSNPSDKIPRSSYGMIEGDFALCISLTHALELLQKHGVRSFYNYLAGIDSDGSTSHNRLRNELRRCPEFSKLMKSLSEKLGTEFCSHPKMARLEQIVVEHFEKFETTNEPTRVIIFSQFRDSVEEITTLLQKHSPLVKPLSFLGHGGVGKGKRITQADQLRIMKQFREGHANTLVSTSVGEEGLDIGDVDLIICYDAHKSPIRLVQRMGRTGRKRQGRIVMLMTEGKEEHAYRQGVSQQKRMGSLLNFGEKLKSCFMPNCPRLVPNGLVPEYHEVYIAVEECQKPTSKVSSGVSKQIGPSAKRKGKKSCFLTQAENQYLEKRFKTAGQVLTLPMPGTETGPNNLDFNAWYLWQNELQPSLTGHSSVGRNLYETMVFINIQNEHARTGRRINYYDLEMQAHLNEEDVDESAKNLQSKQRDVIEEEEDNEVVFFDTDAEIPAPEHYPEPKTEPRSLLTVPENPAIFAVDFLRFFEFSPVQYKEWTTPSPPEFNFNVSPESSPSRILESTSTKKENCIPEISLNSDDLIALCDEDFMSDECLFLPATPPPQRKQIITVEDSPVLSGKNSAQPKRKANQIASPVPAKRIKPDQGKLSETNQKDETLLSVTQMVSMINETPPRSVQRNEPVKEALIPKSAWDDAFDLDFVDLHVLEDLEKAVANPAASSADADKGFKTPERRLPAVRIQSASTATTGSSGNGVAFVVSDEDSPLFVKPHKLKRNLLMTQSTPKAEKMPPLNLSQDDSPETPKLRKIKKKKKKISSFIEDQVQVSDDEGSGDEEEEDSSFENSFIDDESALQTDDMQAIYLRSIKSPIVKNGLTSKNARRPMEPSEIFSQSNVQQDSNYAYDSFCVPTDHEETDGDEIEEITEISHKEVDSIVSAEPDKKRKRIMIMSDSSENEESPGRQHKAAAESNAVTSPLISWSRSEQFTSLSREERLRRQREKQEEFRRKMASSSRTPLTSASVIENPPLAQITPVKRSAPVTVPTLPVNNDTANKVTEAKHRNLVCDTSRPSVSSLLATTNQPEVVAASRVSRASVPSPGPRAAEILTKSQIPAARGVTNSLATVSPATSVQAIPSTSRGVAETSNSYAVSNSTSVARQQKNGQILMMSSRLVSAVPDLISHWKNELKGVVRDSSFSCADFVLSAKAGVVRKLRSDFGNGNNRQKLQEQVRLLVSLFERPFLVVEADRERGVAVKGETGVPSFLSSSNIYKPNTPFVDLTLAALAQTELLVLHSSSQQETAVLLHNLAVQEQQRGNSLPDAVKFNDQQKRTRQFLQLIPDLNPGVVLLLCTQFTSLNQILTCSPEVLASRCKVNPAKARDICNIFRRKFTLK